MDQSKNSCAVDFDAFKLKTGPFSRSCRYHRSQGACFDGCSLCPKKMCPHLYRVAYPYSLSLLYDGIYPAGNGSPSMRSVICKCPSCDTSVEINIHVAYTLPFLVRKLKKAAIQTLQFVGIDGEFPDRNIILKVNRVAGHCPRGLVKGQSFRFNLWDKKELCPASFFNIYPILMASAEKIAETNNTNRGVVNCPDPFGVFYEYGPESTPWNCEDFFSCKVRVAGESGMCTLGHKQGDCFTLEEHLPDGLCPLAFYSAYPYYLTLIHEGIFEWVRKGDNVKVECPRADGIMMEIKLVKKRRLGNGEVHVSIIKNKGSCPKRYHEGDTFVFDTDRQTFCYNAMAVLIPFKVRAVNNASYACSGCADFRSFVVE